MNILFFTHHELNWGSSKERIGGYLPFLQEKGHHYTTLYVAPNSLRKIILGKTSYTPFIRILYSTFYNRILRLVKFARILFLAKKFDLIVIQKVNIPKILLKILRRRNKNIIFDFDDLCFLLPSLNYNTFYEKWHLQWNLFQHPSMLREFKHIIVGNLYLANIARQHIKEAHITVLPTPIDCKVYSPTSKRIDNRPSSSASRPIVGWIGSGENHLEHLKLLVRPLEKVAQKYPLQFVLIGALGSPKIKALFQSPYYSFHSIDWLGTEELAQTIQTFDIGVMPLIASAEAQSKCGFKALAYMASGVATIVSPIGVNATIVQDGINGLWATNEEDWIQKLSLLLINQELRNRLGQEGRKTIENHYSLEKASKIFIKTLEAQLF